MPNWKVLIDNFFAMSDPDCMLRHHAGPGASRDEIAALESQLGVRLPAEFHSFYGCYNGVGVVEPGETDPIALFFRPVDQIASYAVQCRTWFAGTHPAEEERYLPFIDWANGDSSGYWSASGSELQPTIFTFSHEVYLGEPDQSAEDFILPHFRSIADLLTPA